MAAKRQAQVIITANASVAERVMKELEGAATRASNRMSQLADDGARVKDQMRQLAAANKQNTDEYKNLDTQLKQINRDFKEAEKDFQAYNSRIKEGVKDSVRVNEVMKQLSKTASTDLKRALASATRELSKMSEDDKGRQKLINQIARIKEQIAGNNGLIMTLKKAKEQLKNLDNTPMDKLKQGLQALQQQYDKLSYKQQRSSAGQKLLAGISDYKAQMAVNQAGPAMTANSQAIASMNVQQLRSEQQRLQQAYAATSQSAKYTQEAAAYEQRLKAVNAELKKRAEAEREADAAAKQLLQTQQAMATVQAVNKGQKVSLDELTQAYKTLQAQYQKFAGTDPFKAKQAQQNMKLLEAEIKKLNGSLLTEEELQKRIGNTGKYSVKQLQEAYQALQAKLNNLNTSETAAIKATQMQMKNLQREINRATGQVSGFAKAWQTAKQNIMMYVGVFAIVNKIKSTISGLVEQNKALSDSMANIRKVSQWASSDVVKLTENLAKIDTRNTITTLQNLAYQGAKLGIGQYGVEGLTGFVKAAEQVQTALGEDLGEEALPALAKLTEVMGLIPKFGVEQAMQKAGSAIYQLGATSTATGKNIVEFSKRLMGLANVSGVTADELLGLGSAADSMALMPEVAATAFNKLFNSIHGNTENIAKAVGIAKEELQGLLYEGKTMEALVKVFEKMQTMSMKELEGRGVFKELGSDGARLTNVMITMSNKVDMLRDHLKTANEAFSEGKAVINEYLIQQETAAAYFERAANIWTKAFVNPEGVDIVKQLAQEWYNVSYEMTHSASTMAQIRLTLGMIAEAAKTLIQILPTLVQLMMAYSVGAALQNIYLQFRAIQVAATTAGGAMAKFNALMKTNALAFAITGVTFLIAKMYELSEASKAAAAEEEKRQKIFTDAAAEARQVYDEQRKALEKYQDALKDTNATEDERNDIIRKFKNEFGTYLEKLGIEINTYQDMESALRRVNKELKEKAYYETGQKLRESYVGDARSEQTNALSRYMQAAQKYSIPTTVMEDIMEGKITDPAKAIQQVYNNLYGKQYGTGGKLNWIPGKPYQYWVGDQSNVRTTIPTGGATGWVMDKLTGGQATQTEEIYNAVTNLVNATKEVNDRETQVTKFMDQYAADYSPNISVDGAILNLKKLKQLNEDKLNEGLNVLRDAWKEMSEEQRKSDRGHQIGGAIDAYGKQLRAMRGEGYTPPPSAKEIAKQEAERKKTLRAEMKEEQTQAKAIIDNVRNYYQRQINAITEMANTTGMDPKLQEQMVNGMKERMNTALANVRKAIGGTKNKWDEFKQTMRQDLYEPLDENGTNFSTELLDKVMDNNLEQLRKMIITLSQELNQQGSVLLDQILRKASENEGINAKIENTLMRAREKELLEKNYTGKVDKDTEGVMEQFGIAAITDAQSRQIRDWSAQGNDPAIQHFLEMRTKYWQVAFGNARKNLVELIQADVSSQQGQESVLQLLFGEDWKEGLTGSELEGILNMTADQWQVFYMKLIEYTDNWTDAQKKAYDEVKKRQDYLFENSTDVMGLNSLEIGYQQQAKANSRWGKPQTFAERLGLGSLDNISNDPEVKMMEIKLTKAELYYKRMEELRKQDKISEEQLQTAKEQWASAQEALMDKIAEQAKEKMQQIQALLDPIKDFGAAAGEAMYMTVNGLDGEGEAWRNAIKSIIKTYGEMTIQMIEKQLIQMLVMKQHHQEQEDEEQAHQDRMKQIQGQGSTNMVNAQSLLNAKIISTQKKGAKAEEKEQKRSEDTKVDIAGEGGQTMLDLGATVASGLVNTKKEEAQETQQIEQQQQATSLSGLISDTVAKVVLGIAGGSAKTISELGWWGLPLVAVISAALMGLLNYALSAIGSGSKQSNNNAAKTNVKLKSGMLTYDEGNVGMFAGRRKLYDDGTTQVYDREGSRPAPFVGQDGHVYMATPRGGIPEGVSLVKQPIATTVNGQPSLVAEKGPEIVIGRRTTARIMMNEPRLLHHLATLGNGRRGLRTFDAGNLDDMVGGGRNNDITSSRNNEEINAALAANAAALEQNAAAMAAFSQVMQQIQANGIQGVFREYGAGSLDESMRKVNAFRRRYPVG